MLTHTALEVDANGAVEWAAAHPGYYIFPGKMVLDDTGEHWHKRPYAKWTEEATTDPAAIRALWAKYVGEGTAVVCVACAPSGIWVLDQDIDLPDTDEGKSWSDILEAIRVSRTSLVLQSCTKARPHYVFRQGAEFVSESRWLGGDVKAIGIIFISSAPPLVDAPVSVAPKALLEKMKKGRVRGTHGRSACSREEMWDWIGTTPDVEDLVLDAVSGERFLDAIIGKLADKIDEGAHRRQATLDAVFQAAIEAEAGCYPAETAYLAIKEAYREHRESRADGKGWDRQREADFDLMWCSLIPDLRAGEHDDKIAQTRADAVDRYGMWGESDEDVNGLIAGILERSAGAAPAAPAAAPPPPAVVDSASGHLQEPSAPAPTPPSIPAAPAAPAPDDDDDDWGPVPAVTLPPASTAPVLDPTAFWGPHGDLVDALRGRTESADVGVLGALLAFSGAALAGRAHWLVGADIHGPNDYFLNIGASSAARKSSGLGLVEKAVYFDHSRMGTPSAMFLPRRTSGIASGEALIKVWQSTLEDDGVGGKIEVFPERRVMMIEQEASVVWKRAHREASVLGDIFCKAWDQSDLATHAVTSGSTSLDAERHLMGFIGCSTVHVAVAAAKAGDGADAKSGFANRFLWLYLPDSGVDLAHGADLPMEAIRRYQDHLGLFDGSLGRIGEDGFGIRAAFAPDAREKWGEVYGRIKRDKGAAGFIEGMLSRGESHVLRLALNYWLASGGDPRAVGMPALDAAIAVWQYAKASVEYIFGGSTGSRDADNLVAELEVRGGWATLEELRADLNKNTLAGLIKTGVGAGVLCEGQAKTGRPGRPPRVVGLVAWKADGRLAKQSQGVGRGRGLPLEAVTWDP